MPAAEPPRIRCLKSDLLPTSGPHSEIADVLAYVRRNFGNRARVAAASKVA